MQQRVGCATGASPKVAFAPLRLFREAYVASSCREGCVVCCHLSTAISPRSEGYGDLDKCGCIEPFRAIRLAGYTLSWPARSTITMAFSVSLQHAGSEKQHLRFLRGTSPKLAVLTPLGKDSDLSGPPQLRRCLATTPQEPRSLSWSLRRSYASLGGVASTCVTLASLCILSDQACTAICRVRMKRQGD
ncbi:hypothetical protein LY78DRAFT_449552 [Colletotrichum sublineola]|nr:hypothetical protein LY78DRAFT_449552 [Colletotrichum sublineola]